MKGLPPECYGFRQHYNIISGGLVELIVNAMPDLPCPYGSWEHGVLSHTPSCTVGRNRVGRDGSPTSSS